MNFDALLLLSFGGPEAPEHVMPFLENVTRGRGIPRERLVSVAEPYLHFRGGVPCNRLNRQVIRAATGAAAQTGPEGAGLVFTAHSIPLAARNRCGTALYSRQVAYASRLVAPAAGYADYDQVWQSRSGPPQMPWLEPDVADHLTTLAESGTRAVIICPIGFVADHIEVVWDLDHELREHAQDLGIGFARAATPNADPRFARLVADLLDELRDNREPARVLGPDVPPLQG